MASILAGLARWCYDLQLMRARAICAPAALALAVSAAALWSGSAPADAGSRADGLAAAGPSPAPSSGAPLGTSASPAEASPGAGDKTRPQSSGRRDAGALRDELDALLADLPSEIENARVGVSVADLARGAYLYEREPEGAFNVASNAKIVTTATALAHLGPDFRFRTAIYAEDLDRNGEISGDLYVRSSADPYLDTSALRRLVDELAHAGASRIGGDIVIDDRIFDDENTPPHFDDYEEPADHHASYRPPIGAASLNFNTISIAVAPSPDGAGPAAVTTDPPTDYATVEGSVATTRRGRTRIRVDPAVRGDRLHLAVSGQIRSAARLQRERRRVSHPAEYLGGTLKALLEERGIAVEGAEIARGAVPRGAATLADRRSPPLSVIVRSLGKYSNNYVAEMLLKKLGAEIAAGGRPASWDDGLEVVRAFLEQEIGLEPGSYRYENGSGLFDANRFSPRDLVSVLATGYADSQYGPELLSSLAVAGTDGTMRTRLAGEPGERLVRAKTGTLMEVSALSGYVATDARAPLAFAVLMDDVPRRGRSEARELQDEIAAALVDYLGPGDP